MDLIYRPVKENWLNIAVIGTVIIGLLFILVGILILIFVYFSDYFTDILAPIYQIPSYSSLPIIIFAIIFVVSGAVAAVGGLGAGRITYKITGEGLLITCSILHKRMFKFSEIASIEKISAQKARALIEEAHRKVENFKADASTKGFGLEQPLLFAGYQTGAANLTMYLSNPPTVYIPGGLEIQSYSGTRSVKFGRTEYLKPHKIDVSSLSGEFILLTVRREGKEPVLFLLNPEDIDGFISNLSAAIRR